MGKAVTMADDENTVNERPESAMPAGGVGDAARPASDGKPDEDAGQSSPVDGGQVQRAQGGDPSSDEKMLEGVKHDKLEQAFLDLYSKFKMRFYREMMTRFESREASLTTVETFCVEIIYDMGNPTISEFAQFIGISPSNAAYKVNSLIKKGYIVKVQSDTDKREYHLQVTDRFVNYYKLSLIYIDVVAKRMRERFPPEDIKLIEDVLVEVTTELTPEVDTPLRSRGELPW